MSVKAVKLKVLQIGINMKIHYLGTCSGTEPMQGMHHTSLVIETGDSLYWFDAGENCAHTAYTSGIEVMKTRAIFISHPHIDHTGGLANLLSLFAKIERRYGKKLIKDNSLTLFFPGLKVFDAVKTVALGSENNSTFRYSIEEREIFDGLLYEDENIKVSSIHNGHLGEDGSLGWHSFSFLIEAEGKRAVYSGDVASSLELDPIIGKCDLLIHETGHHKAEDVMKYAYEKGVKSLVFTHHGRAIIEDRNNVQKVVDKFGERYHLPTLIAYDGFSNEI